MGWTCGVCSCTCDDGMDTCGVCSCTCHGMGHNMGDSLPDDSLPDLQQVSVISEISELDVPIARVVCSAWALSWALGACGW